jgi:hypothetical protein
MGINHLKTFCIGIFLQNEGCEGEVILYAGLPYVCLNTANGRIILGWIRKKKDGCEPHSSG